MGSWSGGSWPHGKLIWWDFILRELIMWELISWELTSWEDTNWNSRRHCQCSIKGVTDMIPCVVSTTKLWKCNSPLRLFSQLRRSACYFLRMTQALKLWVSCVWSVCCRCCSISCLLHSGFRLCYCCLLFTGCVLDFLVVRWEWFQWQFEPNYIQKQSIGLYFSEEACF